MNLRVRRVTAAVALESAMVGAGRAAAGGEEERNWGGGGARGARVKGLAGGTKTLGEGVGLELELSWGRENRWATMNGPRIEVQIFGSRTLTLWFLLARRRSTEGVCARSTTSSSGGGSGC
jgi:hypothetical protein